MIPILPDAHDHRQALYMTYKRIGTSVSSCTGALGEGDDSVRQEVCVRRQGRNDSVTLSSSGQNSNQFESKLRFAGGGTDHVSTTIGNEVSSLLTARTWSRKRAIHPALSRSALVVLYGRFVDLEFG
jgi:hypothetical protein